MTDAEARRKARESAAQAGELTGVPWEAITDSRKDEFCCRDVTFVLCPQNTRDTGIAIIFAVTLFGYSPNEGLSMWASAGNLLDLFNDPGVIADLRRLQGAA